MCILALDLSTTNEVCVSAPLFPLREEASGAPERHPEVGLLVEHIQRVRVAFWGLLRGLLAALDHALDPSIRHPLLALLVSAITWFRALPFQPNSGLSL